MSAPQPPDARSRPASSEPARPEPARPEYDFERTFGARWRDDFEAGREAKVLMARLDGPDDRDPPPALVRFAQECILSIEWYEREMRGLRRQRLVWTGLMVALICGAFAALGVILFGEVQAGAEAPIAEFSALIAGIFGLLKLLATLTDASRRMGAFHKARALLKKDLYAMEADWRGKAFADGELTEDFEKALMAALQSARAVLDEEQQEFFTSLASPTSLLDVITGSTGRVKDAVVTTRATREQSKGISSTDARRAADAELEQARARLRAAQRWWARLKDDSDADGAAIERAREQVLLAERAVIEAEEALTAAQR